MNNQQTLKLLSILISFVVFLVFFPALSSTHHPAEGSVGDVRPGTTGRVSVRGADGASVSSGVGR